MKKFIYVIFCFAFIGCSKEELSISSEEGNNRKAENIGLISETQLSASQQTVVVGGSKFYVNGKEIFFNGIDTAWQPQSDYTLDFLGRNFNYDWWNTEFDRYKQNHINLARIWIHGAGSYSPLLNGDGKVTGAAHNFGRIWIN